MFGANKPFGSTNSFQSTSFGTASPFGQNTSAFGAAKPLGSGFGTTPFSTAPPNTSIFNASGTSGGTLFGTNTTTFGQPSTSSTGFGGFTGNQSGSSLFNTPQNATGSSLFQSPGTSAFGAPKSSFGGFGGTTNTSLFGQTQQPTSLFNASSNATTGLFGSSGGSFSSAFGSATPGPNGTTIKFSPVTGTDSMMKNGVNTTINIRHQCITIMKEYESKSLEELRMEDYLSNRKGPQQNSLSTFGTGQSSLFGSNTTPSSIGLFNQNQNKSLFGSSGTFGSTNPAQTVFGQPMQQQNTSIFGGAAKPVTFGTPATTTSSFAFNPTGGSTIFGSANANQNKSIFGTNTTQNTGTSLFGSNLQQATPAFGSTGFGTTGFGAQNQTGLFGAKPAFGAPATSTQSFSFVNPTSTVSTAPFGAKPTTAFATPFGGATTNTFGGFGGGTSLFNQNKPTLSFGNTNTSGFGGGLGTLGASGGSLFQTNKPGGLSLGSAFGTNPNLGFGASSNLNLMGTSNLQPNNIVLGSDQSVAQLAQQQTQAQQQLLALAQSPYGDSPLFRNMVQDSNKREEVLKPTNPAAQRALITKNSQYKISPRPSAKVKPQPLHVTVNGKASLFDGLEEDDLDEPLVAFVPRKSVKKLNLKPKTLPQLNQPGTIVVTGSLFEGSSTETSSPAATSSSMKQTMDKLSSGDSEKKPSSSLTPPSPEQLLNYCSISNNRPVPDRLDRSIPVIDNTICELNSKNNKKTQENDDSEKENVSQDLSTDGSVENESDSEPIDLGKPHPAGIILTRPDYYTIPSLEKLGTMIDENKDVIVEDLTIGRYGYGNVFFFGKTNVAKMNLDEIVHFRKKQIIVYPDNESKPPLGEGLNKKAQITLDGVWHLDKTTCKLIKNPERLKAIKYPEFLERVTVSKLNAKFIDYRPETGSWVFEVSHFSKYGLDDSDEEDLPIPPSEGLKKTPTTSKLPQKGIVPPKELMQSFDKNKNQEGLKVQSPNRDYALRNVRTQGIVNGSAQSGFAIDEDDDMDMVDITQRSFTRDFEHSEEYESNEPPSHQLAAAMDINSQRMQVMKASFFPMQMEEDENEYASDKENLACNNLINRTTTSAPLCMLLKDRVDSRSENLLERRSPTPLRRSGLRETKTKSTPTLNEPEFDLSKCIRLPSSPFVIKTPSRIVPAGRLRKAIAFHKSKMFNRQHFIADATCFMGRRFRVGWGPNWTLTQCGVGDKDDNTTDTVENQSDAHLFLPFDNKSKSKSKLGSTCFTVSVKKLNLASLLSVEQKARLADLEQSLDVQFKNSKCAIEDGCPIVTPVPGVKSIHQLSGLAKEIVDNLPPNHSDYKFMIQFRDVWNLCIALWGHIPDYDEESESGNTHAQRMARRKAFTQWLSSVSEQKIKNEIERRKVQLDGHVSAILSHLSGYQISQACQLAQGAADHRLSLLLSQAGGSSEFRKMVQKQLENWEELKADKYISEERLKVFAILSGTLVWPSSTGVVNTCENLDWKRSLAIHLLYSCSSTASITDALIEYTRGFKGESPYGKYCAPPLPPYLESRLYVQEDNKLPIYDVCYHLLRLYLKRSHRLERVLCPSTMTSNPLDYRLSWLLYQSLLAIGFGHMPESAANNLHISFAAQLESMGLWCWAVFVVAHISDVKRRYTLITELLTRHIGLKADAEVEDFLHNDLLIPRDWISLAKASKASYEGDKREEAWHLLKAGRWSQSHVLILRHIAPDAIINESYNYLQNFLVELAPLDRSSTIRDWNIGGQVYLDYIQLSEAIDQVKNGEMGTYELEDLQPNVISLCNRVANIQCRTAKDRLCQSEMAKKTANLLRAVLTLQFGDDIPTRLLVPHLINLPLPEDYAIQELRKFGESNLCEMTA